MSSSFTKNYTFRVSGSIDVPRRSYSPGTLYRKSGDSYSVVSLPTLYTDVPSSVSYRDEVDVTLEVDGRPFDNSVDKCSSTVGSLTSGVKGLTGQVDRMTREVERLTGATVTAATGITAEKVASAELISGSLNRGFSKYIGYLIRERLTALEAKIPATASTFGALSDSLGKRKAQLEQDYERISGRYAKLFQQLNDELRGRILELDRPAFENCAEMQAVIFTNPMGAMLGQSVCAGVEQLQAADAVRVTRLKSTTEKAMELVKGYVKVFKRLSAGISGVLDARSSTSHDTRTIAMPVVRLEGDDIVTQAKGTVRTFMPHRFEEGAEMGFEGTISAAFAKCASAPKGETELEIVDGCFRKRVSNWAVAAGAGGADPRVTEKILALWEKSKADLYN